MEKHENTLGPPLDETNAIRMIHEINRITHDRIKQNCPEMQRSSRLIMMELGRRDNVTQLELVRSTHLKAPTVSVALQKLQQDGIVARKADPDDLRATRVFLTEKGHVIDRSIIEKIREVEADAQSCLTEQEKNVLCSLLKKIKNHLTGGTLSLEED